MKNRQDLMAAIIKNCAEENNVRTLTKLTNNGAQFENHIEEETECDGWDSLAMQLGVSQETIKAAYANE